MVGGGDGAVGYGRELNGKGKWEPKWQPKWEPKYFGCAPKCIRNISDVRRNVSEISRICAEMYPKYLGFAPKCHPKCHPKYHPKYKCEHSAGKV